MEDWSPPLYLHEAMEEEKAKGEAKRLALRNARIVRIAKALPTDLANELRALLAEPPCVGIVTCLTPEGAYVFAAPPLARERTRATVLDSLPASVRGRCRTRVLFPDLRSAPVLVHYSGTPEPKALVRQNRRQFTVSTRATADER